MIRYIVNIDGGYFDYYRLVTRQEANKFNSMEEVIKLLSELDTEEGTGDKLSDYGHNVTIETIWSKDE